MVVNRSDEIICSLCCTHISHRDTISKGRSVTSPATYISLILFLLCEYQSKVKKARLPPLKEIKEKDIKRDEGAALPFLEITGEGLPRANAVMRNGWCCLAFLK